MAASQIEVLLNGMRDSSGNPLAAGKVYSYIAGTTTPLTVYTDNAQTLPDSNPIILDSNGRAQVFAEGNYKLVVKDSNDNTLYTMDNLLFGTDDNGTVYAGTSTGSSNAYVLTMSPAVVAYNTGDSYRFIANFTNSSTATLKIDALTAKNIKRGDNTTLQSGDVVSGSLIEVTYNGTSFLLGSDTAGLSNSISDLETTVATLQTNAQAGNMIWGGTSGGSANAQTITLTPAIAAYADGQAFNFYAGYTNTTTTPTLSVNGLTASQIVDESGDAIAIGAIVANTLIQVVRVGSYFRLLGEPKKMDSVNAITGDNIISTSYTDVDDMSITLVVAAGESVHLSGQMLVLYSAGSPGFLTMKLTQGGSDITNAEYKSSYLDTTQSSTTLSFYYIIKAPSTGSVVYKIQAKVSSGASLSIFQRCLNAFTARK